MGGPHPPLPPNIEGQTYCLRWNNHKSNLVEILDALIKVESYVDCTIVVDDQVQFKAHRVVLAANSPYFQAILQDVPMDHCSIIFPGVKAFEMRTLLDYMYTGEVNVTQSQIPTIMRIAEELEVKGLFDMADLKEKFNKLSEEHAERSSHGYPYAAASASALTAPYATAASSSSAQGMPAAGVHNGTKDHGGELPIPSKHNSPSVISTSSNISPLAAASSTSSPPYANYKSPYSNLYSKSPGPSSCSGSAGATVSGQINSAITPQTPTHSQMQPSNAERGQWPLSPSAAVSLLGSVYDSVPDNPLKRKKLSSMTSMLMNRDTPILRNVLAQANPADSSQPMSFSLPGASKPDKSNADKNSPHTGTIAGHNNNHGPHFNGTDYSSDKKYQDEPHSPYTDRSFDDDGYDGKGNYGGGFSSNSNQKPEWKRYKQYTRSDIMSAIQCVREGMSALQASRKFGVPSRTLYDKVKKLGITTGRPMNRTMKRSPSNVESSAAFAYPHGYGAEPLLSSMHDGRIDEREPKDHHRSEHHHIPPQLPHSLLDHALLQQALESRGGDIAGRGALLLAAAAHAAANRISTSPGPNGPSTVRSPSPPNYGRKYGRVSEQDFALERESAHDRDRDRECLKDRDTNAGHENERRMLESEMEHEREMATESERESEYERDLKRTERECERKRVHEFEHAHERELERERARERKLGNRRHSHEDEETSGHVEDLSVSRKRCMSPLVEAPQRRARSPSYSPPPSHSGAAIPPAVECSSGVIKLATAAPLVATPAASSPGEDRSRSSSRNSNGLTIADNNSIDEYNNESTSALEAATAMTAIKREIVSIDDGRTD